MSRSPLTVPLLVTAQLLATGLALARGTDPVTAEVLFQEARELLKRGKLEQACPKFMESERLDPATATLLAVATCHERQGLLATAWAEFTEAAGRAQREGRKDREKLARERVRSLARQLSTLTLVVAPELTQIAGLRIRRDGVEVGPEVHNRALPIDGGVHQVELSAPGYASQTLAATVARAQDEVTLTLPSLQRLLEPVASAPPVPVPVPAPVPGTDTAAPLPPVMSPGMNGMQVLGVSVGATGLGAAAIGAGFLVGALVKKDQAEAFCRGNACEERGVTLREQAVDRGNMATALGVGGAVLAAVGVTVYWLSSTSPERGDAAQGISLSMQVAPNGAAANLGTQF